MSPELSIISIVIINIVIVNIVVVSKYNFINIFVCNAQPLQNKPKQTLYMPMQCSTCVETTVNTQREQTCSARALRALHHLTLG
jgi:hypothetical protein